MVSNTYAISLASRMQANSLLVSQSRLSGTSIRQGAATGSSNAASGSNTESYEVYTPSGRGGSFDSYFASAMASF